MFQLIKASYKNVVSKRNWKKWFLFIVCLELLPVIMTFFYPELVTLYYPLSFNNNNISMKDSSFYFVTVSILGSVLYGGYIFVYLKELLSDYKSEFINLFKCGNTVVISFLKYTGLICIVYIAIAVIAIFTFLIPYIVAMVMHATDIMLAVKITNIILTVLMIACVTIFSGGLFLNYASKNFHIWSLLDFKSAKKYLCKEYFDMLIYNIAVFIISTLFSQFAFKIHAPLLHIGVVVFGVFWIFITVDMLARIYYQQNGSKILCMAEE